MANNVDNLFTIEESKRQNNVSIKVVGVGGGGTNMINYMVREGLKGIDMIAINTDAQSLQISLAPSKIQLGNGLGAGGKPDAAKKVAESSYDQIKESLKGADLVFVAAGMGGGTGTGASGVVAQAAKENGALTIGVCTEPFSFEGPKRTKNAKTGIEALRSECDSIVVIPNDKLLAIVDKNMGYAESFAMVDAVLARAVRGISAIVLPSGLEGINTDFNDLQTVMSHKGQALMGIGYSAEGSDSAYDALKDAIESPLLDNLSIDGASGVLVHFQIHPSYPLTAINRAMQIVQEATEEDSDVILGTSLDESLRPEEVRVTIVVTGRNAASAVNNVPQPAKSGERKAVYESLDNSFRFITEGNNLDTPSIDRVRSAQKKVVGGYDYDEDFSKPSYIRQQLD